MNGYEYTGAISLHDAACTNWVARMIGVNNVPPWSHIQAAGACVTLWSGAKCIRVKRNGCAAMLRGCAVGGPDELQRPDAKAVLNAVLDDYLTRGTFEPHMYEGAFTIVLADGPRGRLKMFRNLAGNSFTYYQQISDGVLFSSSLAKLIECGKHSHEVDREMLPVYFIYRFVPGGRTLIDGVRRLQSGEMVSFENGRLNVEQVQTFAVFEERTKTNERESIERLESTMTQVVQDYAGVAPEAAGLLSGGVDSTYVQVHWNNSWRESHRVGRPRTTAVWVDHPTTAPDQEYALSAVKQLATEHLAVRIDGLYADRMRSLLAAMGEMPNHVQTFYFATLGREMASNLIVAGLCGEGADGLFGSDVIGLLRYAKRIRGTYHSGLVRKSVAAVARATGHRCFSDAARVANVLNDENDARHPLNTVGAFTDWRSVVACFGRERIVEAMGYRRRLLDQFCVPDDPFMMQRAISVGYLGEAVNTAAYWTSLLNQYDVELLCPYMDSRIVRVALNIALDAKFRPNAVKSVIKMALARHVPRAFVDRPKRGFGQPIFEWLSPGGSLRSAVEAIGTYEFVDKRVLAAAKRKPNWFLYSLLVYDMWHKTFFN